MVRYGNLKKIKLPYSNPLYMVFIVFMVRWVSDFYAYREHIFLLFCNAIIHNNHIYNAILYNSVTYLHFYL